QGATDHDAARRFAAIAGSQLHHLFHNKHELTWIKSARMSDGKVQLRENAMDLGLRGRKALVTGASRGIGRACAEALAEEGCGVVLVSRTAADLEAAKAKIAAQHNVAVRCFPLDLSD